MGNAFSCLIYLSIEIRKTCFQVVKTKRTLLLQCSFLNIIFLSKNHYQWGFKSEEGKYILIKDNTPEKKVKFFHAPHPVPSFMRASKLKFKYGEAT